jgi:hypothetical protein
MSRGANLFDGSIISWEIFYIAEYFTVTGIELWGVRQDLHNASCKAFSFVATITDFLHLMKAVMIILLYNHFSHTRSMGLERTKRDNDARASALDDEESIHGRFVFSTENASFIDMDLTVGQSKAALRCLTSTRLSDLCVWFPSKALRYCCQRWTESILFVTCDEYLLLLVTAVIDNRNYVSSAQFVQTSTGGIKQAELLCNQENNS